jgi:FolB domain-containing protein
MCDLGMEIGLRLSGNGCAQTASFLTANHRLSAGLGRAQIASSLEIRNGPAVAKLAWRATSSVMADAPGDRIRIEELEVSAQVGITGEERSQPQRISLNITAWPETAFEKLNDDITRTVNYVDICQASRELVQNSQWKLIETIASKLTSHLLEKFPLIAAEVEIHKFVLPNTKRVSVTTKRKRTG